MISIKDENFGGTFPFAPHYLDVNGSSMHFVDEGAGEPVLMLHGDPTWGYLYRKFIPVLSATRRCIVPDHMGMGKSDVPREPYPYRLRHHVANLETLALRLDLSGVTLVAHDWGGPVGLGFALRHPDRIKRLVLMNTWAFAPWPGAPLPRLLEIIRSERGEKFVLEKNGYLEPALLGTTHHRENLTTEVMDAYRAPFPTPESRTALLCWSRDIPVSEADPSFADMKRIEAGLSAFKDTPTQLIWGMRDPVLTPAVLRMWQEAFPRAISRKIEDASYFLQEDAAEQVVEHIREFLQQEALA
jgi:pimeloyl-ACP methyl ester carboxylesterase